MAAKNIINLPGTRTMANGSSHASSERLNQTGGADNDVFASKTGNPNDGPGDTLSGGTGNSKLTVGGDGDVVDGGAYNDVLVINYDGDMGNFGMNGVD